MSETNTECKTGRYALSCRAWNGRHVKFALFDGVGANCGEITVLATDVFRFIQTVWRGDLFWNGKVPEDAALNPNKYGAMPK